MKRAPKLMYFLQEAVIPSAQLGNASQTSSLDELPWPGDRIYRDNLRVTFLVDEKMDNYSEIYAWMVKLASPDSATQYASLSRLAKNQRLSGDGVFSDLTVSVSSSTWNPNMEFRFQDAYPVGLGNLRFTMRDNSPQLVTVDAEFKYRHFTLVDSRDG